MNNRTFIGNCDLFVSLRRNSALDAIKGEELCAFIINYLEKGEHTTEVFELKSFRFLFRDNSTAEIDPLLFY